MPCREEMMESYSRHLLLLLAILLLFTNTATVAAQQAPLRWQEISNLPNELGVAGPFVGVHRQALIIAGGANFPQPVWESEKSWLPEIHVLTKANNGYTWNSTNELPRAIAYGAAVSLDKGVLCMGGNDSQHTSAATFLLSWNAELDKIDIEPYPPLPSPCAYGQAVLVGDTVYLAGGQSHQGLDSALNNFWSLDVSQQIDGGDRQWRELPTWPGPPRAFNLTVAQHNGYEPCVYVISGRTQDAESVVFLRDVWEFAPSSSKWRQRTDAPRCVMAGTGIGVGQSHIYVLGGADGSLFAQTEQLKDQHPGFPREALRYHTITDTWTTAGSIPVNHVTTTPVLWDDQIVIASGEVRPRVRSPTIWSVQPQSQSPAFGSVNYVVLFGYLAAMVAVGCYYARKNTSTEAYFRGGSNIPWWAAGCSIFATMLSSLTYTGIPSKAYAQDWVYAVGNGMIPVIAFVAVYIALPFYRRLDVTSAYEYLELRFNRWVRWFGSISFTLFHVFRMAVVMSLTGLALAVATSLTPTQAVLLMGCLSMIYSTIGGIEAVIWTDTLQTVVLLGGALLAICILVLGVDDGLFGTLRIATESDKLRIANMHWDATHAQLALWVVVVGSLGQNVSSYTADQAVVQRYMTTRDEKAAARSIWTNAILSIPATLLFFGIGTALFAFYRCHPERLDATLTTDQIFPLFIAREMPAGLAGLIVAGIFSAAQSTVSTSMNSTATTLVTDILRPLQCCRSENSYLRAAQVLTLFSGIAGTGLGLLFVNPDIKSLFEAFIKVIGLFMGVLGGLFILGIASRRANAFGAMIGAIMGTMTMASLWLWSPVNGYLYTAAGITSCVASGYLASLFRPRPSGDLHNLTLFTRKLSAPVAH
ncbi:MAG: sodium/solute symporter [Planctomycetales bacterium]|nr:sodium/solute symporter [Planctomycetales bacterium]